MHRSCCWVNAFEPPPVERSKDWSSLVNNQSSSTVAAVIASFVSLCADLVAPCTTVFRRLGIFIDADVSMRSHVTRTVSSCFEILRQLHSIRRAVPRTVLQSLMSSHFLTGLHGNATLSGIAGHLCQRLQSVMNAAARNDLFDVAYKSYPTVPASVENFQTNWLKDSRPAVQAPVWDCSCLSSWWTFTRLILRAGVDFARRHHVIWLFVGLDYHHRPALIVRCLSLALFSGTVFHLTSNILNSS